MLYIGMKNMIDVLIPTYKRKEKLPPLIQSFKKNSSQSRLLFIINIEDEATRSTLEKLGAEFITCNGEYVECINFGVKETDNPFIFCGADDIEFSENWEKKLLKVMEDPKIMVTGGIDDWQVSKSGVHISHPLIRREYLKQGAYWNATTDDLYCPEYKHYQCDIEMEQLAHTRGVIKVCTTCEIPHNHFVNKKADDDQTYVRSRNNNIKQDTQKYNERKKAFEYYDTSNLHQGLAVESQYRRKKLSIVIPIWNCEDYAHKTIDSLIDKTFNKYEVILIDDNSSEHNGKKLLQELATKCLKNGFTQVKTVVNTSQKYCNANWNKGVELSTGDYIAIINSDIEFMTDDWDEYLIENLDLGYELVNPYEVTKDRSAFGIPAKGYFENINHIKGCCFMMSREFVDRIFPIPKELVHWFGDTYISNQLKDTMFDIRVKVFHHGSKSSAKVDKKAFWQMVYKDFLEYEKITERHASIKEHIENSLKLWS